MTTLTADDINQSISGTRDRYEALVRSLTNEQLISKVHDGDGGWTTMQLLAHLAAMEVFFDRCVRRAGGETLPPVDPDAINVMKLAEREGRSVDDLLAEYRTSTDALMQRVSALPTGDLERELQLGPEAMSGGALIRMMGSGHTEGHMREIESAFGQ